jgi:hypothetical protein
MVGAWLWKGITVRKALLSRTGYGEEHGGSLPCPVFIKETLGVYGFV